jgi:hypothetical protein
MGVDPLLGGKLDRAFDRFAQNGSDAAAGCFNGPIQNVGRRDAEDRLSRRVAPTDEPMLIARDDPRGDGGEERFSERFLQVISSLRRAFSNTVETWSPRRMSISRLC